MLKIHLENKIKNVSKDFILNLIASIVATGVLQILVYPVLAQLLNADEYGVLLTLMGVANTVATTIGGSLNNTRLLMNWEYEDAKVQGDFTLMLIIMNVISSVGVVIAFYSLGASNILLTVLLLGYVILSSVRLYANVAFRIIIDYRKILTNNIVVAVGNIIGILILYNYRLIELWPLPFCIGELLGIIHLIFNSNILQERIGFTSIWKRTCSKETVLMCTTLTGNLLTYLDRLLLLPLLGGEAVTTYTVASVFGKSLGIVMTPLAGVLLSYFTQRSFKMTKKIFRKLNLSTLVVAFGFLIISMVVSNWFTRLLYPTVFSEALKYILVANLAAIIGIVANMIQPAVLRFAPTYWQLIIQIIYCAFYLGGGIIGVRMGGLEGFSIVAVIAAIVKVMLLYVVGEKYVECNS